MSTTNMYTQECYCVISQCFVVVVVVVVLLLFFFVVVLFCFVFCFVFFFYFRLHTGRTMRFITYCKNIKQSFPLL